MAGRFPKAFFLVRSLLASALFLCLHGTSSALADEPAAPYELPKQFSVVQTIQNGAQTAVQHLYRDGDKLRLESQEGAATQIIIVRKDQKKVYTVLPADKRVTEITYQETAPSAQIGPGEPGASWTFQQKETLRGHACAKYFMKGSRKSAYVWVDEAGKYPVRIAAADGTNVADWDQYQAAPQPPALFEPPADYQKTTIELPKGPW
ncbi:MAG: hypothetical protein PHO89_06785 [Methylacidiphilaceae bacterium]|nr:hypothetical protein [Candidatus Methylacidiphilaceae bacterium]